MTITITLYKDAYVSCQSPAAVYFLPEGRLPSTELCTLSQAAGSIGLQSPHRHPLLSPTVALELRKTQEKRRVRQGRGDKMGC